MTNDKNKECSSLNKDDIQISVVPTLETMLKQLPFKETYSPKKSSVITTALIIGALFVFPAYLANGNTLFPTAILTGLITSLVIAMMLLASIWVCYPIVSIFSEEGICIKIRERKQTNITWHQITEFTKVSFNAKQMINCEINPQPNQPKTPKNIIFKNTTYDVNTTILILEMLRQHFIKNQPRDHQPR